MAELKTKENQASVDEFLNTVADEKTRKDCYTIIKIMGGVTKAKPKMWGTSIIGFGTYHYKYASGHEGDMCQVGFSPRKGKISLYLSCGLGRSPEIMARFGKHKAGKGCIYIKSIDDINQDVFKELIVASLAALKKQMEEMKMAGK